jgi:ribosomal protein S18 acetylase RimI-like enzyme
MARLRISVRDTKRVSQKIATELHDLTLSNGTMWDSFLNAKENKVGSVYIAKLDGEIVGWLLQRPMPPWEPKGTDDAKIFVHPEHRREGIGRKLIKAAQETSGGRMVVYPWNKRSGAFFDEVAPKKSIFCDDWSERGIDITEL